MGYINYEKAECFYSKNKFMMQILAALKEIDKYHLLRDSKVSGSDEVLDMIPEIANEYREWLMLSDGGLLFSTALLSVNKFDDELKLNFADLVSVNNKSSYSKYGLPRGYFIIALMNYGDPVCLSYGDKKIYLWNSDERVFETVWETFADFLADEYNTAVQMIDDEILQPVPMKSKGGKMRCHH